MYRVTNFKGHASNENEKTEPICLHVGLLTAFQTMALAYNT